MTLRKLIDEIGDMAIAQKCINFSAGGTSLAQMNPISVDHYPFLFQSPTGNHTVKENTTVFELTLYYVDRIIPDYSNDIDIFSAGIEQLKNIVNGIKLIDGVCDVHTNFIIRNFCDTEKMNDSLAGAYVTVQIEVVNDTLCFIE